MGKGAYYVGHPDYQTRFRETLGYTPFPGTLNLRLSVKAEVEAKATLRKTRGETIASFEVGTERFSSVKCFKGSLNGEEIALTIPKITEYDDTVLELVAVVKLRDRLGLRDDQQLVVSVDGQLVPKAHMDSDPVSV